jgi:uncharacterized membrane protein YdbT with pleckstrin-like domain
MSAAINTEEKAIWEGVPSQWINFKTYAYSVIVTTFIVLALTNITKLQWMFAALLLYPVGRSLLAWYTVRSISYKLTAFRILFREGVFNRITTETKLSDVREVLLIEPWYKRMVGLGDIQLNLKGFAEAHVIIYGIRQADEIKELITRTVNQHNGKNTLLEDI